MAAFKYKQNIDRAANSKVKRPRHQFLAIYHIPYHICPHLLICICDPLRYDVADSAGPGNTVHGSMGVQVNRVSSIWAFPSPDRPVRWVSLFTHIRAEPASYNIRCSRCRLSHSNVVFSHWSGKFHLCARWNLDAKRRPIDTATYNKCTLAGVSAVRPLIVDHTDSPINAATLELIDFEMQASARCKKKGEKTHRRNPVGRGQKIPLGWSSYWKIHVVYPIVMILYILGLRKAGYQYHLRLVFDLYYTQGF